MIFTILVERLVEYNVDINTPYTGLAAAQSNAKVKEIEGTVKSLKQALEETEQKLVDQYNREKLLEEQANDSREIVSRHVNATFWFQWMMCFVDDDARKNVSSSKSIIHLAAQCLNEVFMIRI